MFETVPLISLSHSHSISIYLSIYRFIYLSIYRLIYLSIYRFIYLLIDLSIYLFIHLSISPYRLPAVFKRETVLASSTTYKVKYIFFFVSIIDESGYQYM